MDPSSLQALAIIEVLADAHPCILATSKFTEIFLSASYLFEVLTMMHALIAFRDVLDVKTCIERETKNRLCLMLQAPVLALPQRSNPIAIAHNKFFTCIKAQS